MPIRFAGKAENDGLIKRNFYCRLQPDLDIFIRNVTRTSASNNVRLWLLHGAGMDSAGFDLPIEGWSLMESLARRGYDVFALDYRGHGLSSRVLDGKSVDISTVVDDCSHVIEMVEDAFGGGSLHLIGESFGSILAPLLAKRLGDSISSVTLLGPIFGSLGSIESDFLSSLPEFEGAPGGYAFTTEEEWGDLFFGSVDPKVLRWHQLWFGTAYAYPVGPYLALRNLPVDRDLNAINCPTLAVMGSLDPFASEGSIQEMFGLMGSDATRLFIQDGIGHLPYVEERASEVIDAICDLVDSTRATGGGRQM